MAIPVNSNLDFQSVVTINNLPDAVAAQQPATKFQLDAKVTDAIVDGVTTVAPSQNAVFDALVLKANDNIVIKKDGSVTFTANQPLGGFKFTGAAAATANGEFLRFNELGVANGVASLDGGGKIPSSQLPNAVMEYQGNWVASTNTPALADGVGSAGDVYRATDAGTVDFGSGNITFATGDWAVYSGSIWEKSVNSNTVVSVFGRTGVVVAVAGDYTATQITNTPSGNLASITVQAALNELQSDIDGRATTAGTLAQFAATTSAQLAGVISDETGTGALVFANSPTLITPALGTPSALVGTNITGVASGLEAGTVTSIGNLTGDVTSTNRATSIADAVVTGKLITGYTSGAGTVAATDTILQAIQKLNGNQAAGSASASGNIGDGVLYNLPFTHSLGTLDVHVSVVKIATGVEEIVEVVRTSTSVVTVKFNTGLTVPASNSYRITVSR